MESIVHFTICKSLILYFLKYINFGQHCTIIDVQNCPRSGEFASFRRYVWSNALFFPGYGGVGLSTDYALFKAIFFPHALFHYTVMLAFFTSTLFTHEMIS